MTQVHGPSWPEDVPGKPAAPQTQPDLNVTWLVLAVVLALSTAGVLLLAAPSDGGGYAAIFIPMLMAELALARAYAPVVRYVVPRLRRAVTARAQVVEIASRTQTGMTHAVVTFTDGAGTRHQRTMCTMVPVTVDQQLTIHHDPTDPDWALPDGPEIGFYRAATPTFIAVVSLTLLVLAIALALALS